MAPCAVWRRAKDTGPAVALPADSRFLSDRVPGIVCASSKHGPCAAYSTGDGAGCTGRRVGTGDRARLVKALLGNRINGYAY